MSSPTPASGSKPSQPAQKIPGQTTAPKTNQSAAYWSALVVAVMLALVFALGHLPFPIFNGFRSYGLAMRYFAFPLFAFLISVCANVIVQQMTCGHLNAGEIFLSAGYFLAPLYAGLLAGTSAYLRAPIASLVSPDEKIRGIFDFERRNEIVLGAGKAYWVFFGAFIGQVLAGAMSAVC